MLPACCPQGDDYILYCHPNKQKTPKSDRLRFWYLDMLKQAKSEQIVVHITTLWDTYFPGGKDHRMEKCSATHIPYMEGDYWPGGWRRCWVWLQRRVGAGCGHVIRTPSAEAWPCNGRWGSSTNSRNIISVGVHAC